LWTVAIRGGRSRAVPTATTAERLRGSWSASGWCGTRRQCRCRGATGRLAPMVVSSADTCQDDSWAVSVLLTGSRPKRRRHPGPRPVASQHVKCNTPVRALSFKAGPGMARRIADRTQGSRLGDPTRHALLLVAGHRPYEDASPCPARQRSPHRAGVRHSNVCAGPGHDRVANAGRLGCVDSVDAGPDPRLEWLPVTATCCAPVFGRTDLSVRGAHWSNPRGDPRSVGRRPGFPHANPARPRRGFAPAALRAVPGRYSGGAVLPGDVAERPDRGRHRLPRHRAGPIRSARGCPRLAALAADGVVGLPCRRYPDLLRQSPRGVRGPGRRPRRESAPRSVCALTRCRPHRPRPRPDTASPRWRASIRPSVSLSTTVSAPPMPLASCTGGRCTRAPPGTPPPPDSWATCTPAGDPQPVAAPPWRTRPTHISTARQG